MARSSATLFMWRTSPPRSAAAVENPPKSSITVDIGVGEPITIMEAATVLADLMGAPAPIISGAFRDGDVRAAWCGIEAAEREFGYHPVWKFNKGARSLLEWVHGELA